MNVYNTDQSDILLLYLKSKRFSTVSVEEAEFIFSGREGVFFFTGAN
jgi:hypothetical protein